MINVSFQAIGIILSDCLLNTNLNASLTPQTHHIQIHAQYHSSSRFASLGNGIINFLCQTPGVILMPPSFYSFTHVILNSVDCIIWTSPSAFSLPSYLTTFTVGLPIHSPLKSHRSLPSTNLIWSWPTCALWWLLVFPDFDLAFSSSHCLTSALAPIVSRLPVVDWIL